MTIPANILKQLDIGVGSTLELYVTQKGFTAQRSTRKRYTLKELLHGTTQKNMKALKKQTKWSREGKPVGREIT